MKTLAEKQLALSRMSLREDQLVELHLTPLPEPAPEMLKLPGFAQLWAAMKLMRERDIQAFHRMLQRLQSQSPAP